MENIELTSHGVKIYIFLTRENEKFGTEFSIHKINPFS